MHNERKRIYVFKVHTFVSFVDVHVFNIHQFSGIYILVLITLYLKIAIFHDLKMS